MSTHCLKQEALGKSGSNYKKNIWILKLELLYLIILKISIKICLQRQNVFVPLFTWIGVICIHSNLLEKQCMVYIYHFCWYIKNTLLWQLTLQIMYQYTNFKYLPRIQNLVEREWDIKTENFNSPSIKNLYTYNPSVQ